MAQLVRAPPCHGGGRGFEPHPGRLSIAIYLPWDLSSAGRASALQAEGHRFEPCRSHLCRLGSMAEQLICNQQVVGSTPTVGSDQFTDLHIYILGGFPSGQRGQTVNLLALPSKVRILLRPLSINYS